jgi:hypothetical protein
VSAEYLLDICTQLLLVGVIGDQHPDVVSISAHEEWFAGSDGYLRNVCHDKFTDRC